MERYSLRQSSGGDFTVECPVRGQALLNHPMFNKGSAFSADERDAFGLHGLVPPHVSTLAQQARRIYQGILRKSDPLEQYIGLAGLQDRNEVLFYHLMLTHLDPSGDGRERPPPSRTVK